MTDPSPSQSDYVGVGKKSCRHSVVPLERKITVHVLRLIGRQSFTAQHLIQAKRS